MNLLIICIIIHNLLTLHNNCLAIKERTHSSNNYVRYLICSNVRFILHLSSQTQTMRSIHQDD